MAPSNRWSVLPPPRAVSTRERYGRRLGTGMSVFATAIFLAFGPHTCGSTAPPSTPSSTTRTTPSGLVVSPELPPVDCTSAPQVDPHRIVRQLEACPGLDLGPLWAALSLSPELSAPLIRLYGPRRLERCEPACTGALTPLNLDDDPSEEIVLTVRHGGAYRYLVFDRADGWTFLGAADEVEGARRWPEIRAESAGGRRFLVVDNISTWGTGVGLDRMRWFEIRERRLREVLDVPEAGLGFCDKVGDLCRRLTVEMAPSSAGTLAFWYTASYEVSSDSYESIRLFEKRQRAVYTWDSVPERYLLSPRDSEISSDEIRRVFELDHSDPDDLLTCASFLRFNRARLLTLANGPDRRKADWVRRYAEACTNSPEAAAFSAPSN
jgi:hypothetical protein